MYGKAVTIEEDLKAIGSRRGNPRYKSWLEDFTSAWCLNYIRNEMPLDGGDAC